MISNVLTSLPFRAPVDPDDTARRRAILELLRAADNDNPAPPRLDSDDDRAALLKPEFAPRLIWKRLREVAEGNGGASNWYAATHAFDDSAPSEPEASVENLWSVDKLMEAAHAGVDYWQAEDGRIVPYGGRSGALVYSGDTGRLIRCGALELADDTRREAQRGANDNEPLQEPKPDAVEIIGGIKRPSRDNEEDEPELLRAVDDVFAARVNGRNVRTHDRRAPHAGSIIKIRHRNENGELVTLTRPRNVDGAYRERETEPPPPIQRASAEDAIDARQRIARLIAILDPQTVAVLDHSIDAPTFASIGEHLGKSGDYAKRAGRNALIKACAELDAALQKENYKYAA